MSKVPTQTFIVRLPVDKARRVARIVDELGSSYYSVDEFIGVAVENQLALEGPVEDVKVSNIRERAPTPQASPSLSPTPARPIKSAGDRPSSTKARSSAPTPGAGTGTAIELLCRPDIEGLVLHDPMNGARERLSPYANRLTPFLAGPRTLANLTIRGSSPSVDVYVDTAAKAARVLGFRLRTEDDAAGRRGRRRRSTGWPIGEDESKSVIRYRNCFMFSTMSKGVFGGPLLDLGLVAVADGKSFLTETGAAFARSRRFRLSTNLRMWTS